MNHPIGTTLEVVLNFTGDVTSPTGTLYVNGSSVGTVVTLSTTGDQVVASCSTTGRSVGDRLYLSVAGTVGGGSETQRSAQRTMDDPMRGTEGANTAAPLDAAGTRSAVGLTSDNLASIINDCAQGSVWTGARA
ncbi:MAG: hypothetical protein ACPGVG_14930, partial [Mycobacterium sp.]